jgi:hypothetical protein
MGKLNAYHMIKHNLAENAEISKLGRDIDVQFAAVDSVGHGG